MAEITSLETYRIRIDLEYEGTDFFGWQLQARERTVQGVLEQAFSGIYGNLIRVTGAGRTDTGVHAKCMVSHCDVPPKLTDSRLKSALNGNLPKDVRVHSVKKVPADFHARFSAKERWYRYVLARHETAIGRNFTWHPRFRFDVPIMQECAQVLIGEHDFSAFSKPDPGRDSYVCNVIGIRWEQTDTTIEFIIGANRFLHHMVRNILGTLLDIGRCRIKPDDLQKILTSRDRRKAGTNIPPQGLFLEKIVY